MSRLPKKSPSIWKKPTLLQPVVFDERLGRLRPVSRKEWAREGAELAWSRKRRRREQWRVRKRQRLIDRLRAAGWINFGDITEWCARESGSIALDEAKRSQAYNELWKAVCAGEFDESRRTQVLLLNPSTYPQSLTRESGAQVLHDFSVETFYSRDLVHCWVPGHLCRQWFERRNLKLPPHLYPPGGSGAAKQAAHRGEKRGDAPHAGKSAPEAALESSPGKIERKYGSRHAAASPEPTRREQRTKDKQAMYAAWRQLVDKYRTRADSTPRARMEIAKLIAADPAAADPTTKDAPEPASVYRRLNEQFPGWYVGQKKVGKKKSA